MSNPFKEELTRRFPLSKQLQDRSENTRFWNLFDSGAPIGELAAAFGVTAQEVRKYLQVPDPYGDIDDK
jgi:hypothetical protein